MKKRILAILLCFLFISIPVRADFESELAAFPAAWQDDLRALHEKYPEWIFVAVPTGLSWNTAVQAQVGKKSLVEKYYNTLLRNHGEGHYNPNTGAYTYHDASTWVSASAATVDYFMNPANFLNEIYIFQFEALSYDRNYHTREGVELILKNTFMHNALISYVAKDGTPVQTERTYSEVIMEAAEKSNVSPYYLASKIRTEIGITPSGSVTGTYPGYEGLYNFYNIGANDGANPIANGLNWASLGTSYGRPWTTPELSIINGAVWIGELYISKGQNTMYFERFNVVPNSGYALFTHQYMTNVYAVAGQAKSTYTGYQSAGTLADAKVFYIPTFLDMPADNTTVSFSGISSQAGISQSNGLNIRSGPSTAHPSIGKLRDADTFTILGGSRTDSTDRMHVLEHPYWYKIQAGAVTGYVSASYVTLTTSAELEVGQTLSLAPITSYDAGNIYWENTNRNAVSVGADGTVTAKAAGNATVYAFTSGGGMAAAMLTVNAPRFFTDIQNHWAEPVIRTAVDLKLFSGTTETTFSPDEPMTRAMFITVLGRLCTALGNNAKGDVSTLPYLDVDPNAYYAPYVAWAYAGGILPFGETAMFSPSSLVTRGEMALAAYNLACFLASDMTANPNDAAVFFDYAFLSPFMQNAAAWCVSKGVLHGMGNGLLGMDSTATRAQVAQIIMNLHDALQ